MLRGGCITYSFIIGVYFALCGVFPGWVGCLYCRGLKALRTAVNAFYGVGVKITRLIRALGLVLARSEWRCCDPERAPGVGIRGKEKPPLRAV